MHQSIRIISLLYFHRRIFLMVNGLYDGLCDSEACTSTDGHSVKHASADIRVATNKSQDVAIASG